MRRYFDLEEARRDRSGPSRTATIGFFDGVHRGHRRLLDDLRGWARETNSEATVVTFRRHPQAILGGHPPTPVVSLEHRLLLLEREGIGATLVLDFDEDLVTWSPERFVADVLRGALGVDRLLFGFDGAFGQGRRGDFAYVRERERELGIEARSSEAELVDGERVSSTALRRAIASWDLPTIERLLGRRFSLFGRVVHGDHRGRTIGFPTANLDPGAASIPPPGVYHAGVARLGVLGDHAESEPGRLDGPRIAAVVNIGRRPTVSGQSLARDGEAFDPLRDRVEAHLLDFDGDLYGEHLEVEFLAKERDERRFESIDALARQIGADVAARRRLS